jgi:hypothetical protein
VAAASEVAITGESKDGDDVMSKGLGLVIPDGLLGRAPYSEAWGVAETGFALLVNDVVAERALDLESFG